MVVKFFGQLLDHVFKTHNFAFQVARVVHRQILAVSGLEGVLRPIELTVFETFAGVMIDVYFAYNGYNLLELL